MEGVIFPNISQFNRKLAARVARAALADSGPARALLPLGLVAKAAPRAHVGAGSAAKATSRAPACGACRGSGAPRALVGAGLAFKAAPLKDKRTTK